MIKKARMLKYKISQHIKSSVLIPVCRKNRFLSDLYYCFFSNEFSREHQKVLNGRYSHYLSLKSKKPNEFHLRRETHRLEKGLIMKERRSVFATDYINDIVNNYKILSEAYWELGNEIDTDLLVWSGAVLSKYFASVGDHPQIKKARETFSSVKPYKDPILNPDVLVPFFRKDREYHSVSYDNLYKLALQRRSVRWYINKAVPRDLIEKAVNVATLSPTACNRQPFEFRIFDAEDLKNTVGSIPMGIKGFYEEIPVFVVLVGKLSAYISERDRHVIYIDGGLTSMSFMYALETLGLSSVPINWPDIEALERKMESLLNLKDDERPLMLMGVGYADPDQKIPYSQKKSPKYLIKYN